MAYYRDNKMIIIYKTKHLHNKNVNAIKLEDKTENVEFGLLYLPLHHVIVENSVIPMIPDVELILLFV